MSSHTFPSKTRHYILKVVDYFKRFLPKFHFCNNLLKPRKKAASSEQAGLPSVNDYSFFKGMVRQTIQQNERGCFSSAALKQGANRLMTIYRSSSPPSKPFMGIFFSAFYAEVSWEKTF